jgi:hypothetical protein
VPIKTYECLLYLGTDLVTPIITSGELYPDTLVGNGDTISYEIDGLESAVEYGIKFKAVTQNDYEVETTIETFTVVYDYPPPIPTLVVTPNNTDGTIELSWVELIQKLGYVDGTYSYVTGKFDKGLQLDTDSVLYYPDDTIPAEFTVYFWVKIPNGYNGTLVQLGEIGSDGMSVFFTGNRFGFSIGDAITAGRLVENSIQDQFIFIGIKHAKLIIKGQFFEEILII